MSDDVPVMVPCPSCAHTPHVGAVSPMVILWAERADQVCTECRGEGAVQRCPVCRGEGTRAPDPGEREPDVGFLKCRRCLGFGTARVPVPPIVPRELGFLGRVGPQGRILLVDALDQLPVSSQLYIGARMRRMGIADEVELDAKLAGWRQFATIERERATPIRGFGGPRIRGPWWHWRTLFAWLPWVER